MKHITLSTKKTKSWYSYCWLKVKEDIFSSTLGNRFVQNRKKAKLAAENYGKSKTWKFSYQKPPSGVKLDNIINEVLSTDPNKKCQIRKRRYNFLIFVQQFHFRQKSLIRKTIKSRSKKKKKKKKNKEKKKERKKKNASKVKDEKLPVCDSCKSAVDVIYLTCALCIKVYHFSCAHPLSNFGYNVSSLTYVCPWCVYNNNTLFHHFLLRGASHIWGHLY